MAKQQKEKIGLTKALGKIAKRYSLNEVFADFLQMTVCAYSIGKMEDEYNSIAKKYNADEIKLFGEALGELIYEHEISNTRRDWVDVVGKTYEEVNSASHASRMGQFFTPVSLCKVMAEITQNGETLDEDISVCDPSCGSSRNLVAHSQLNPQNRFKTWYVASDLDQMCVNMSVINYLMFGLRGIVIHMNALTLEVFGGYRIYLPETGMGVQPMSINECKSYVLEQKKQEQNEPEKIKIIEKQQLTLF